MTDSLPRGFPKPTWFQVPDDLVDIWAPHLTGAELKVILYICRRTAGFGKIVDSISYQQFLHGIVGRDGERLDSGAGISAGSLPKTLAHLEELGLIIVDRHLDPGGDKAANIYRLRWREETEVRTAPHKGGTSKTEVRGTSVFEVQVPQKLMTQETVIQERDSQETDLSNFRLVPNGVNHDYDEARQTILAYVDDFARELADRASLKASTTRAYRLYERSGLNVEAFTAAMLEARAIVKERSAAIRSATQELGRPFPTKRKMGYFFAVLEDRLGLKSASNRVVEHTS
jgi:hypothetical protein